MLKILLSEKNKYGNIEFLHKFIYKKLLPIIYIIKIYKNKILI